MDATKFSPLPVSCEVPRTLPDGSKCVSKFVLGCVYTADVGLCPAPVATPVPASNEVTLALMVTAVIVIAIAAIRRKP